MNNLIIPGFAVVVVLLAVFSMVLGCTQEDAKEAVDKAAGAVKDLIESTEDRCKHYETQSGCVIDQSCQWHNGDCAAK